jgi:protein-S-isoprenylcysteine O-methyltransferase Ste14
MTKELLRQAVVKLAAGILLMAALLFLPAGTLQWPEGRRLMIVLFVPMVLAGFVMMRFAPELLRRRLNAKEEQTEQKGVILGSGVMFIAGFVLAGLGVRFHWHMMPAWASMLGTVTFLLAYAMFGEVLRENEYLSRTVEVQEGQKVVDTGLYGVVRHPMYAATLILFLSMPLVLRAPLSFLVLLGYLPVIVKRIRGEEAVLARELPGYPEYMRKVRFRLIPGVW